MKMKDAPMLNSNRGGKGIQVLRVKAICEKSFALIDTQRGEIFHGLKDPTIDTRFYQ